MRGPPPPKLILEVNTTSVFRSQPFPSLCPAPLGFCWAWAAQSQNLGLFSCILDQLVLKILYPPFFSHSSAQFWILPQALKQMSLKYSSQKRTQMWDQILHFLLDKTQALQTCPLSELKQSKSYFKSQTLENCRLLQIPVTVRN